MKYLHIKLLLSIALRVFLLSFSCSGKPETYYSEDAPHITSKQPESSEDLNSLDNFSGEAYISSTNHPDDIYYSENAPAMLEKKPEKPEDLIETDSFTGENFSQ